MRESAAATPDGTRDRLYSECLEIRRAEKAVMELFRSRGYWEVMTPEVEYYDLFARSGNPLPQEDMLKIIDRSGKIIVMRPDNTTPIARLAATKLRGAPLPLRLCYSQTVFRSDASDRGRRSEIAQCGIELMGASGLKSDLEVIITAVQAMEAAGAERFHIELGHSGFFRTLASKLDADEDTLERMRRYIERKNFAALSDTLEPFMGSEAYMPLKKLSGLFGGPEVLDEAEGLFGGLAEDCLYYLRGIYEELDSAGYGDAVRFDLGLVHQLDYYTGVVFSGYAIGAGRPLLTGGRYDALSGYFGEKLPSTGFAIDMEMLAASAPAVEGAALDTVVFAEKGRLKRALELIDASEAGTYVLSTKESLEECIEEAGALSARRVLRLGGDESEVCL